MIARMARKIGLADNSVWLGKVIRIAHSTSSITESCGDSFES